MASRYCRITIESQFGDLPKLETKFESTKVLEITEQMALTIFQSIVKGIQNVYPHPIIRITYKEHQRKYENVTLIGNTFYSYEHLEEYISSMNSTLVSQ